MATELCFRGAFFLIALSGLTFPSAVQSRIRILKRRKKSSRIKRLDLNLIGTADREPVNAKGLACRHRPERFGRLLPAYAYAAVKTRVVSDKFDL